MGGEGGVEEGGREVGEHLEKSAVVRGVVREVVCLVVGEEAFVVVTEGGGRGARCVHAVHTGRIGRERVVGSSEL